MPPDRSDGPDAVLERGLPDEVDAVDVDGAHLVVRVPFEEVDDPAGVARVHHPALQRELFLIQKNFLIWFFLIEQNLDLNNFRIWTNFRFKQI